MDPSVRLGSIWDHLDQTTLLRMSYSFLEGEFGKSIHGGGFEDSGRFFGGGLWDVHGIDLSGVDSRSLNLGSRLLAYHHDVS